MRKIEKIKRVYFCCKSEYSKMPRKRNKTPLLNSPIGLDEEINDKDFPYYPYIPIKTISDKQKKIIQRHQIAQKVNETEFYKEQPNVILPATTEYVGIDDNIDIITPVAEYNYTKEIQDREKHLSEIDQDIQYNLQKLYEQQQLINANEQLIQDQVHSINENKKTNDANVESINQQIASYNHNLSVISTQCNQVNNLNVEIHNLSQILSGLQSQITVAQTELQNLNFYIDSAKNQLGYHGNMLNAFNTLIQNPQYFMQMITSASDLSFESTYNNNSYYST